MNKKKKTCPICENGEAIIKILSVRDIEQIMDKILENETIA